MIVYVLKAVYGAYFNDYTTGYKLTYIPERAKISLLYYNDVLDDFVNFALQYVGKNGSTVEINRNRYSCDLVIEVTNDRKNVLKTLSRFDLEKVVEIKRNNKKKYNEELKKLFEVGETKWK